MENKIRTIRKLLNLSQQELADALGVSRSYICKMESGERILSDSIKNILQQKYDFRKEWLDSNEEPIFIHHPGTEPTFVDMVYHAIASMDKTQLYALKHHIAQKLNNQEEKHP